LDEEWCSSPSIHSTLQIKKQRDVSSASAARAASSPPQQEGDDDLSAERWNTLVASAAASTHAIPAAIESEELDLVQASERRHLFDKILLIVHHGETETQEFAPTMQSEEEQPAPSDALTGRGIGQALSLSRRTAAFCNDETGLSPELVLVAPSRSLLHTLFLSFPYDTPHQSIQGRTQWICYPTALRSTLAPPTRIADLQREFPGIDISLCRDEDSIAGCASNERLLQEASGMLDWLKMRDQRVVVGKSFFFLGDRGVDSNCFVPSTDEQDSSTHATSFATLQFLESRPGCKPLGSRSGTTEPPQCSTTAK